MSLSISDNNFSVIRHPKLPLVILRTDYLAIAKGNHCAAKLLAILENWTNWFVRKGKFERWVRLTTEVISQHLLEEHNKAVIQKAVSLLVSLGFIRREQKHKRRHDRSWFYWFDIEKVQQAIDTLDLPGEPKSEEDYLKMDAALEPDIPVTADALPTSEQPAPEQNPGQLLLVTHDTPETANHENSALVKSEYSLEKEAETRVVIDPPKMVNREAKNGHSNDQNQPIESPKIANLLNKDLNNQKISSSISSACARKPRGEEDFEILEKKEEQEAADDNAIRSGSTSTRETTNEPEGTSTPQPLTPLIAKPKINDKPKDLDRIEYSGGGKIAKQPTSDETTGEAALLKWVMEVKIPTLELDDPPRNLEAYAKAMIWRDGDALRKEHGGLVRDRLTRDEGRALGSLVHARAEEWRQAGIHLGVGYDAAGRPYVRMNGGNHITALDFLEMPIEPDAANINKPVEISPEHIQKRKVRQSRLKTASALGDRPEFEFLVECWQDVLLRPQIKALIAKYPQWAIFVDAAEQLQSFFD